MDSGTWEDFEVFCFSINMLIALLGQRFSLFSLICHLREAKEAVRKPPVLLRASHEQLGHAFFVPFVLAIVAYHYLF